MKKILLSPWLALITLSFVVGIRISDPTFVESIRLRYFDTLITSNPVKADSQITIVNIDDETIKVKGQFPFPRNEYAEIIKDIYNRGAGLVVFNIFMPEADRFAKDYKLSNTLKEYPVVLPQTATNESITNQFNPFRPGVSVIGTGDVGINYQSIQPNIKEFNDNAAGIGVVNTLPEIDGVIRRIPMVVASNGLLYPSIGLETMRVAAGDQSFQVKVNDGSIEAVRIPKFGKIQTDSVGRIWVKPATFTEYSANNLPESFNSSIVIVGLTARGLNNPVATANGAIFPHQLQASILNTVMSGTNISRPDWSTIAELTFTTALSIISILLVRWKYGFILVIGTIGSIPYLSNIVFDDYGYLLDSTIPILGIFLVLLHCFTVKFIIELNAKLQIKKQFGTYLSPALVEKLQKNPELLKLGGESKELSIMFTDVRGFATISEHYGTNVQGLTQIMNRYMTAMTAAIIKNNGTLDKYIGDAQMAFWNAPLDEQDHAKTAVKTAFEMMESLDEFNETIIKEGIPAFGMGLGINTATVVIGNMGSVQRFDYTCLGDGVNLASRLEGQSKPYAVRIVIGALTAQQIEDEYFVLELDKIAVKGKKEGVNIFTVLPITDAGSATEYLMAKPFHNKMLKHYRNQRWDIAYTQCNDLMGEFDGAMDKYYKMMCERINDYKLDAAFPKDWDGVYISNTK